jgi:hypothetical protein
MVVFNIVFDVITGDVRFKRNWREDKISSDMGDWIERALGATSKHRGREG